MATAPFKVTVSHAAKDSYLSQVVKLVDDAQKSKSQTQLLADTAAKWLTPDRFGKRVLVRFCIGI